MPLLAILSGCRTSATESGPPPRPGALMIAPDVFVYVFAEGLVIVPRSIGQPFERVLALRDLPPPDAMDPKDISERYPAARFLDRDEIADIEMIGLLWGKRTVRFTERSGRRHTLYVGRAAIEPLMDAMRTAYGSLVPEAPDPVQTVHYRRGKIIGLCILVPLAAFLIVLAATHPESDARSASTDFAGTLPEIPWTVYVPLRTPEGAAAAVVAHWNGDLGDFGAPASSATCTPLRDGYRMNCEVTVAGGMSVPERITFATASGALITDRGVVAVSLDHLEAVLLTKWNGDPMPNDVTCEGARVQLVRYPGAALRCHVGFPNGAAGLYEIQFDSPGRWRPFPLGPG